jgi:hypothetical protein
MSRHQRKKREAPPALFGWLCNRRGAGAEPVASTRNLAQLSAWRGSPILQTRDAFPGCCAQKSHFPKTKSKSVCQSRPCSYGWFISLCSRRARELLLQLYYYYYCCWRRRRYNMLCIPPPSAPPTRVLCASRTNTHTRVVEPACCTSFGAIPLREKRGRRRLQPPPPRPAR